MRLKKLILQGFKSFADRTEFLFEAPITGIVGPNGCGKSNVVDGLKWVLGEQSAKSLRGDAMADVIFNGSATRKPSGMAEVILVFENLQRPDGTRTLNIDSDEVSVGRRLFRDGASEYVLGNQPARLKDIRELFLDTGVGVDAYSVIEQGRVALLLESNPQERRLIFEEAAGISKFKARKKESQRKLERVDQNLLRVNDVVSEVDKQLRSVRVQAGRARTYQEYSTRLAELRLTYALQEYHQHHSELAQAQTQATDAQFQLDDAAGNLARAQNSLSEQRIEGDALAQQRRTAEYELVQARAAVQSARQRQEYARQQLQQIAQQLEQMEQDRAALELKATQADGAWTAENASLEELTNQLEERRGRIEAGQVAFRDAQLKLNALNQEVEGHRKAILDLMRQLASTNNALGAGEIENRNLAGQQERTGRRQQVVLEEISALGASSAEAQSRLDGITSEMIAQQTGLDAARAAAAALGKRITEITEQLGAAKEHRSGLVSRQKLLEDLEARREGVGIGVQSVLRRRLEEFPFVRGLVADLLNVDVAHAHVIEAALEGRDQWLVSDDAAAADAAGPAWSDLDGRVNVLCTDRLSPVINVVYNWAQHEKPVRRAVDLVRHDVRDACLVAHLLGRTAVVADLATAVELRRVGPSGWRYVTEIGEVLEADGTLRAGPLNAATGLISRRSELQALAPQIEEVDGRIGQLTQDVAQSAQQSKNLEEDQNTLRNAIYQANTAKVELSSQLAQLQDKLSALQREQPVLERELQSFADQMARLQTRQASLQEERGRFDAEQTRRQTAVSEQGTALEAVGQELRRLGEELTGARVELGQVQEKQLAARQQVQRLAAAKVELTQQLQRVAQGVEGLAGRRTNVERELQTATDGEATAAQAEKQWAAKLADVEGRLQRLEATTAELATKVESLRGEHGEIEQTLHRLQLRISEATVRLEALVKRTLEELSLDLPARYAESQQQQGDAPATDWDAVAAQIKELREKVQRLGNVNLDAIGEQQTLEERQTFLHAQVADLASSKKQLEELIQTINEESALRFEQTFNAVREHFQGMFRKLFGGGKADVFLETELPPVALPAGAGMDGELTAEVAPVKRDILDAGIEIIARPPGKQPVSISQLSGGEKTMTCVALLLSIFKSKPSPFCLLDEVDAALDEANNQRFNAIVQEFLGQSQFVIITHSKRTMQIADVLYGITMQEQGVSRRVSVQFEQVDAQGQVAEHAAA